MLKQKTIIFLLVISSFFFTNASQTRAQMMGSNASPSINPTDVEQQQQDETTGKTLLDQLQNKQTTCQKLTSADFEKIGEYVMSQRFKNTDTHIQMNSNIKNMMGDIGEENMHTKLGMVATGCKTKVSGQGGGNAMMGWNGSGWSGMMGGNFGWFGIIPSLFWLVGLIDLILLGIFLWKHIQKK